MPGYFLKMLLNLMAAINFWLAGKEGLCPPEYLCPDQPMIGRRLYTMSRENRQGICETVCLSMSKARKQSADSWRCGYDCDRSPGPSSTNLPSQAPTATENDSIPPSDSPMAVLSDNPSIVTVASASSPATPSHMPSTGPSLSARPTSMPSKLTSISPSLSGAPTDSTSNIQSIFPSSGEQSYAPLTASPTDAPSIAPSLSGAPTQSTSDMRTFFPTSGEQSGAPFTESPTHAPSALTVSPTLAPSLSGAPTHSTLDKQTMLPSSEQSGAPSTMSPTLVPSTSGPTYALLTYAPSAIAQPEPHHPSDVDPSDVTLLPPNRDGPIVASITAYNWRSDQTWSGDMYELPMYKTNILDRDKEEFWTYLLDELLLSRLDLVLLHGRGCHDAQPGSSKSRRGTGSMCPRLLDGFVAAVERAGVQDIIRVGMWDDTGMYRTARNTILGTKDSRFDVGDESNWHFFWDYNIKIFFDTIPRYMWFLMDGRPVIASWNLRDNKFVNQQGNASRLLTWLSQEFNDRYGVRPFFVVDSTWFSEDRTLTRRHADGKHGWFNPLEESYTYTNFNGEDWGVVVPGFRNAGSTPGCGSSCREVWRFGAMTLQRGLAAGKGAKMIMLEGWVNMAESSGTYRSNDWAYPTRQLNKVREYSDPEPETLLFQAEGADTFRDSTPENVGSQYADRGLDVGALDDGTGWYVGWTEAGEWLEYRRVTLGCGLYRFSARVATSAPAQMRLALGSLPSVLLGNSDGEYRLVHMGEIRLTRKGKYNLRVHFDTGGIDLDWFFLKRIDRACASQKEGEIQYCGNIFACRFSQTTRLDETSIF